MYPCLRTGKSLLKFVDEDEDRPRFSARQQSSGAALATRPCVVADGRSSKLRRFANQHTSTSRAIKFQPADTRLTANVLRTGRIDGLFFVRISNPLGFSNPEGHLESRMHHPLVDVQCQ